MDDFDWNSLPPPRAIAWPIYPADSPARRDEMSTEAFNEDAARAAFGDACIDWLTHSAWPFRGDWWWLALLWRSAAYAERIDQERKGSNRFKAFTTTADQFRRHGVTLHLEQAYLANAHLEHADLSDAHLEHAYLCETHLEHADLWETHLEHARLSGTHLEHADLRDAHLEHANLGGAHLEHADLVGAHLKHAKLREACLDHANVRRATGILFDDCRVQRLNIEGNAPDPWSVLRRTYTGPMYFVHLLLVAGFLLPYAAKVLALTTTARTADTLRAAMDSDPSPPPDKDWWWFFVSTAIAILLYNILRGYLTLNIGVLRGQADRVERTPTLEEYYGPCHPLAHDIPRWRGLWFTWIERLCSWFAANREARGKLTALAWRRRNLRLLNPGLWRLHLIARVLFWISLVSVAFHVGAWILTTTVPVPR